MINGIEVVEPQGATTILQINIGQEKKIIAQINEQWGREAGEKLTLAVASELIHLFDPKTPLSALRWWFSRNRDCKRQLARSQIRLDVAHGA